MDAVKNFGKVTVSIGYDDSATSIALSSGDGERLPNPSVDGEFNLVWWNETDYKDPSEDPNREIIRVTARSTDTLTIVRPASGNDYNGEGSENTASSKNTAGKTYRMILSPTKKTIIDLLKNSGIKNILKNGNFINNSSNGYGATPDDWTNSNANPVQGGFPSMTKQQLIDLLGIADGDIEGLWNLNEASGNATDLSANAYHLTDNNTVGASEDGLMGKARDFELDNSESFSIADASAPNLEIAGNKTWFAFIKPETIATDRGIMCKYNSTGPVYTILQQKGSGAISWVNSAAEIILSDVKMETGKWYFVVGVSDVSNNLLKVWVNGIKKQATGCTASPDTNSDFYMGDLSSGTHQYLDALMQYAGVLSVALTDSQVKKLFAATLYRGQKIRRATTDAYLSQALPEDLVERLRGKDISIVAKAYQAVASTAQVSIDDGTEEESIASAITGSWIEIGATKTISATATAITLKIKHSDSDGNSWFKEVAVYEGNALIFKWYPSYDDISRFPRLLKMDFPKLVGGYPYQYEEKRTYQMIVSAITGLSATSIDAIFWSFAGRLATLRPYIQGTSNNAAMTSNLPIYSTRRFVFPLRVRDSGSIQTTPGMIDTNADASPTAYYYKNMAGGGFAASGTKGVDYGCLNYEID